MILTSLSELFNIVVHSMYLLLFAMWTPRLSYYKNYTALQDRFYCQQFSLISGLCSVNWSFQYQQTFGGLDEVFCVKIFTLLVHIWQASMFLFFLDGRHCLGCRIFIGLLIIDCIRNICYDKKWIIFALVITYRIYAIILLTVFSCVRNLLS